MPAGVARFAEFELDSGRYELRRGEHVLKLEKIPMELLTVLVESNGQLVTRDEIIEKIWGKDVFLDTEHGINTAIRKIRQALGDDPEQPRFVQTVTGKGYRFIAPLTEISEARRNGDNSLKGSGSLETEARPEFRPIGSEVAAIAAPKAANPPAANPVRSANLLRAASLAILAVSLLAAALVGFNVRGWRDRLMARSSVPRIHALAVLPLENLSGDPSQDYFADGMTDELITMLAKNPALRVISRTSVMRYKKVQRPLPDIARELGVDGILEGSVGRSGNRVHVTAQLIHAGTDTHVWAESYDRDLSDVNSLQTELAQTIAQQVGFTVSVPAKPERRINPEAHDAYLLGRYYWFASDSEKCRPYFQKAIDLQPDYAAAWSGLADYYMGKGVGGESPPEAVMPQGEEAAQRALALDDSLVEAHNSMAAAYLFYRWDWKRAEQESARAVELNPNFAEGHHLRGYVLGTLNRADEALQEQRKAMELDPFARPWALGYALIRARQFDAALNEARVRSEAQPNDVSVRGLLVNAYRFKGMEKEAAQEWERMLLLAGNKESATAVRQAFARDRFKAVLEWELNDFKKKAAKGYVSPLEFADSYAGLRRKDEAIHYLELAYKERAPYLVRIQSDPNFDFLHSDPRYQAVVRKMGLPAAQ